MNKILFLLYSLLVVVILEQWTVVLSIAQSMSGDAGITAIAGSSAERFSSVSHYTTYAFSGVNYDYSFYGQSHYQNGRVLGGYITDVWGLRGELNYTNSADVASSISNSSVKDLRVYGSYYLKKGDVFSRVLLGGTVPIASLRSGVPTGLQNGFGRPS